MNIKVTSLLAAALFAGGCTLAMAQAGGGAGGGGGGAGGGAGSDISVPKLNSGPGGTAPQTGPLKTKKVHFTKKKKHRRHM
jgi:hypothetical protein